MSIPWRDRELLTVREVSEILSLPHSRVRRRFPLVRVFGAPRVRVEDVRRVLGELAPAEPPKPPPRVSRKAEQIVRSIRAARG